MSVQNDRHYMLAEELRRQLVLSLRKTMALRKEKEDLATAVNELRNQLIVARAMGRERLVIDRDVVVKPGIEPSEPICDVQH